MEKIISFYRTHKRPIVLGTLAVFALSIPIIVAQVLKQQDLRQNASAGAPVTLSLSPSSAQKNIGDTFDVQLLINTNTNDISAVDGYLKYYDNILRLVSVTPSAPYFKIDGALDSYDGADGIHVKTQQVILYNPTQQVVTGDTKVLITFKFEALANGVAAVGFYSNPRDNTKTLKIAASGFSGNVPLSTASGPTATFTIGTAATATPTTGACVECAAPPAGCTYSGSSCSSCGTLVCVSATPTAIPTTDPTATTVPSPTATPATGETRIIMAALLPGIGKVTGDNQNPNTPSRAITAILRDYTTKVAVGDPIQGSLVYEPASGLYKGTITLPATFQTGQYDIKIKMNNTLYKMQQGITVTAGTATNTLPATFKLVPSDLDQDNKISLNDYTLAVACLRDETGCTPEIKARADTNDNGSTIGDTLDFQIVQHGFAVTIEGD